jgi:hypothetical protein
VHPGRDVELGDLDSAEQTLDLAAVEAAGAEVLGGFGAARDPEAQAVGGAGAVIAGGDRRIIAKPRVTPGPGLGWECSYALRGLSRAAGSPPRSPGIAG